MLKKKSLVLLMPTYLVSILLIVGCAFTSQEVYIGRTMFIPLKSSPQGARVILDGKQEGITPMTLKFTYLLTKYGGNDDEIRERILKIEKDGYAPYILSFSIKNKEHEKIPNPVFLTKSEDSVEAEASIGKTQQKKQKFKGVKTVIDKTVFIVNAVDPPIPPQKSTHKMKEAKEEVKEPLEKINKPRNEIAPLKDKKNGKQKIKKNNDTIATSTDKDNKNIVQARYDKKIEHTTKFNKKSKVDSQYTSITIYTIQTGSFLEITHAQEQYDLMLQILKGKASSFLRIEKIGKYYSVRLGKFSDSNTAKQFIAASIPNFSNADIIKAYIKKARIIKFNEGSE
jgi:hypothetical protein